jgi:hypothetical protein
VTDDEKEGDGVADADGEMEDVKDADDDADGEADGGGEADGDGDKDAGIGRGAAPIIGGLGAKAKPEARATSAASERKMKHANASGAVRRRPGAPPLPRVAVVM